MGYQMTRVLNLEDGDDEVTLISAVDGLRCADAPKIVLLSPNESGSGHWVCVRNVIVHDMLDGEPFDRLGGAVADTLSAGRWVNVEDATIAYCATQAEWLVEPVG
jgi:hypothetical protein